MPSTWGACCAALTTMTSLRTLRISVSTNAFCHIKKQMSLNKTWLIDHGPAEDFILQPLELVARSLAEAGNEVVEIDVELAWAPKLGAQKRREGWETKGLPRFVVKRRPTV